MPNEPEAKENKATNNCRVDAETKESLLKHLDEHGAVSFLTSAKFGQIRAVSWKRSTGRLPLNRR